MTHVPSNAATMHHIAAWVMRLAQVTRQTEPVSKDVMANYASLLANEFPSGAFTAQSLSAVAESTEFFPAYAVLRKKLTEWWTDRKPKCDEISDDRMRDWSVMDKQWLGYWHKRQAEGFAPMPERPNSGGQARVASLIRVYSPKAWRYIATGGDAP